MKKIIIIIVLILSTNSSFSQTKPVNQCMNDFDTFIKKIKSNEGNNDGDVSRLYSLFYLSESERKNNNSSVLSYTNSGKYRASYQIDENSGLIFLITENLPESWSSTHTYELHVFHPIIGPLQFYYDPNEGSLFLPHQTKKVSVTSRNYSPNLGFTLTVKYDESTKETNTEIEDSYNRCCNKENLSFMYSLEIQLNGIQDYAIESNLNSYFGTKRVLDKSKTKEIQYNYIPSYEEKLVIYRTGGLPKSDLENPNFSLTKTKMEEVYKNEVYGRKGLRHYLNDCYEEMESSFGNYLIFKSNGKYGILDASFSTLKSGNYVTIKPEYDKIQWNQGTETFTVTLNSNSFTIDVNGNVLKK